MSRVAEADYRRTISIQRDEIVKLRAELEKVTAERDEAVNICKGIIAPPYLTDNQLLKQQLAASEALVTELEAQLHEWEITVPHSTIIGLNAEVRGLKAELAASEAQGRRLEEALRDITTAARRLVCVSPYHFEGNDVDFEEAIEAAQAVLQRQKDLQPPQSGQERK